MSYTESILSRRGPLGKVWLAAHMERKLSKTQTLQTDIEESVDAILHQEFEVMALRVSGQLLLGVVRIYSRKAKYLLEDCNEAMSKIKMAFSRGVVDMAEEQLVANKNAITIQANTFDFDLMPDDNWLQDFEDRPAPAHGQHQAHINDITLPPTDTFEPLDFDNNNFDLGPSDGIGSQDFFDLGVDFGDAPLLSEKSEDESMSVDGSVGVGRDAASHRDSIADQFMDVDGKFDTFSQRSRTRELSEHPFGADMNIDMPEFGDVDLGDIGIGFDPVPVDVVEKTPAQSRSPSRASSPLSEPPPTPPPETGIIENTDATPTASKIKRKLREKKQIIDVVTELEDGPGAKAGRGRDAQNTRDLSDILTQPHFLPRSNVVIRLLEVHNDPIAHFLPTKVTPEGTFFCAAPPGLAPELTELFLLPMSGLGIKRRGASPGGKGAHKRQRLDPSAEEDEGEIGRRAESAVPDNDILARGSLGPDPLDFGDQSGLVDDFQLDVPPFDPTIVDLDVDRAKSAAPSERSRLSTPALDGIFPEEDDANNYANADCPIAMFDVQTQSQATDVQAVDTYSKNTVKAISVIRKEVRPTEGDAEGKVLSFKKMADKASRRAAASFFFELLVLSTRDCINVTQPTPFENIEVRAKDKLWELQHHAPSRMGSVAPNSSRASSRAPSVARSLASTMGL
ncbi:hypothetical protein GYMLUDRAFT_37150 [Collybiopsis luxurians FD-317 M1]|nr:hypothetical protein GYMLUDRAFT_37150 [Collybiopsis luxurians FD-317 M1]